MVDALDVMTNLDRVVPYYQAVFSADEHTIIGYEVVGRIKTEEGVASLGPFFQDNSVPDEYRLEVDNLILEKALQRMLETNQSFLLFVHRDANMLMNDGNEAFLTLLLDYQKKGLKLEQIVLEITEQDFQGNINHLNHLLVYHRTYGIQLAINRIGKGASNLERIGLLAPDILKVDLKNLRQTTLMHSYQDVLYSISLLARRIGATLLYEDIDAFYQLQYAWRNGGRYYQGDYLWESVSHLLEPDVLKERLRKECRQFIAYEKGKLQSIYMLTEELRSKLSLFAAKYKKHEDLNKFLLSIKSEFSHMSFRMYICDEDGFQQSANLVKRNGDWDMEPQYLMKNWSWRPYFLENIMQMRFEKKGRLSDLYADIETGDIIRTFSFPLDESYYLFIDLSYEFLYEQDGLL
ncbi:EAL-associated domain-containing protein [Bacillus sp. 165]|uniref:EAL-associated domain-containing protein n=1 Tax=Bacillus sp. 165 TaxID=1529117 RepID=UPI001ADA8651|nr:EAL-associated domain-containing protein [Bacillus sp. 165]MBO9130357.1 EAL domain-containing protein [Bacillus sp. 165]